MLKSAGCYRIYIDETAENVMALLFADYVTMCSETVGRLREMIKVLEDFSKKWELKINLEKNKNKWFSEKEERSRRMKCSTMKINALK